MRVGVIRGDLPGPVFMADLEPSSQPDYPTEPVGQTRYIGRPDLTKVGSAVAAAPAAIQSTGDITFPLTVTLATNDVLRLKVGTGAYVVVTIAAAVYANMAALLVAVNAALVTAGIAITAKQAASPLRVRFQTTLALGPGSIITLDTTGHGSTANAALGYAAGGGTFTVPTAAATIVALLPVSGPLDVSSATILTTVSLGLSVAQVKAIADTIAPQFVETDVAIKSFEVGNLSKLLASTYTPDPTRYPAVATGAAITVVQDDGVSAFAAAPPVITGAVHNSPNAGDITITGTGLASTERDHTVVDILNPVTGVKLKLSQKVIRSTLTNGTQGVVSPTSIVIPKSLLVPTGDTVSLGAAAGVLVSVRYTSLSNTNSGSAASIGANVNGVMTLTGLVRMNPYAVGGQLVISGAANPGNNGSFFIVAYVSATSVKIANPVGIPTDGNNGAIVWKQTPQVVFVTT